MAIDANEATEYLAFNLEWDSEPVLSQIKKLRLLNYARAVDVNGVSPGASGYVETYSYDSLNVAIAKGWEWKEAAAVELHEDDEDEIYEHCKQMAAKWSSRVAGLAIGGTSVESGSFAIPNTPVW